MPTRIYRDNDAGSVVFEDSTVATQFTNSLQAIENDEGLIDIFNLHGPFGRREVASVPFTEVAKEDGSPAGSDAAEVVNYLNSEFNAIAGGGPSGNKPTITSSLTESVVSGEPFNYTIVATENPTYYDASGYPVGLAVNAEQGILFGSTTLVGSYPIQISAVNGNGTTTETLNLTVLSSGGGFVNTKSVRFAGSIFQQYLDVSTTSAIERKSNEAWSISQWIYFQTLTESDLWAYGSSNNHCEIKLNNSGAIVVRFQNSNSTALEVEGGSLSAGVWYHLAVTNDGSETAGGIRIYIDAVSQSKTTNQDNLSGNAGTGNTFRIGRAPGNQGNSVWLDAYIDEWAYYDVKLSSSQITSIYNGGTPDDLGAKAFVGDMKAWYRMGDGDLYPILTDNKTGNAHPAEMKNMTILNFASFTP